MLFKGQMGLVLSWVGGVVILALEKRERVTMEGRSRDEIKSEIADAPTTDNRGKEWNIWWTVAGEMEVLLVVSVLDVDRNVVAYFF